MPAPQLARLRTSHGTGSRERDQDRARDQDSGFPVELPCTAISVDNPRQLPPCDCPGPNQPAAYSPRKTASFSPEKRAGLPCEAGTTSPTSPFCKASAAPLAASGEKHLLCFGRRHHGKHRLNPPGVVAERTVFGIDSLLRAIGWVCQCLPGRSRR